MWRWWEVSGSWIYAEGKANRISSLHKREKNSYIFRLSQLERWSGLQLKEKRLKAKQVWGKGTEIRVSFGLVKFEILNNHHSAYVEWVGFINLEFKSKVRAAYTICESLAHWWYLKVMRLNEITKRVTANTKWCKVVKGESGTQGYETEKWKWKED